MGWRLARALEQTPTDKCTRLEKQPATPMDIMDNIDKIVCTINSVHSIHNASTSASASVAGGLLYSGRAIPMPLILA